MRFEELKVSRSWNGSPVLEITLPKSETKDAENLIGIEAEKYELTIKKMRKKRSLDANAYFWIICGEIAKKLKAKSKEDVYRNYIKETGAYEILPIRSDVLDKWRDIWENKGEGWVTEDIGECKNIKGYHNVKCYYGTSVYNTDEMSHLIDLVVQDAKDLGIETATPDEVERMKSLWKNGEP